MWPSSHVLQCRFILQFWCLPARVTTNRRRGRLPSDAGRSWETGEDPSMSLMSSATRDGKAARQLLTVVVAGAMVVASISAAAPVRAATPGSADLTSGWTLRSASNVPDTGPAISHPGHDP